MTLSHSPSLPMSIARLLINGAAVFVVAQVLPGIRVKNYFSAVGFAFLVGILNTIVWHWLGVLTISFSVLTLGLGALVINGALFLFAGSVISGIEISGCFTAALASLAVTFTNWVLAKILVDFFP